MVGIIEEAKNNGWSKYEIHVLEELKRNADSSEKNREEIIEFRVGMVVQLSNIKSEIAVLKTKAGAWGVIGGAIPVGIALLVYFVQRII